MRQSHNVQITELSASGAYDADYYTMLYGMATKQSSKNLVFSFNFMLWHLVLILVHKTIIGLGFCKQNYQCPGKSYQPRLWLSR